MFNRRIHEKDLLKSVVGASLSLNRNLYGEKSNDIGREGIISIANLRKKAWSEGGREFDL